MLHRLSAKDEFLVLINQYFLKLLSNNFLLRKVICILLYYCCNIDFQMYVNCMAIFSTVELGFASATQNRLV